MKIAIIRLSAIGDVIMALPALEALRKAHPLAHIAWIVERRARNVLDGHPALNEIIEFPRWKDQAKGKTFGKLRQLPGIWAFRRFLRQQKFDLSVDFQGNLKSGLCTHMVGAPVRIGYGKEFCREPNWLFTNKRFDLCGQELHRMQSDLLVASLAGAEPHFRSPQVTFTPEDCTAGDATLPPASDGRPAVVLHPGTSDFMPHKRWPLEHYANLGARLQREADARLLLSWGPGEMPMMEKLQALLSSRNCEAEIIPNTPSMRSLGYLLSRADLLVGGDTGPIHLAVALGVPVINLMGPSDPRHYYPYGHPNRVFYRRQGCSPCRNRGCQDLTCLWDLSSDQVAARALEVLTGSSQSTA